MRGRLALALMALLALGLSACSGGDQPTRPYSWNDLRIVTAYTAKTACSCLFVEERSEEDCRTYARQSPAVATWKADLQAKTVESSAALVWTARARYAGDRLGCELE